MWKISIGKLRINPLNKNGWKLSIRCFKCFVVVALTHIWRHNAHRTLLNKNPDFLTQKVQRPRYVDWKYFTYLEKEGLIIGLKGALRYTLLVRYEISYWFVPGHVK